MTVKISASRIFSVLMIVISFLTLASFGGHMTHILTGYDTIFGLRQLFDMNNEMNVPSWYSACALFVSSALLLFMYQMEKSDPGSPAGLWLLLCLVFQFLAFDEAFSVHEDLWRRGHNWLVALEITYFTWFLPAMVLVSAVFFLSLRYLFRLDPDIRKLMLLSGACYVGGAAFIEELGHLRWDAVPSGAAIDPLYVALSTCEEFLEMFGVVLFIYTLLRHIERRHGNVSLSFESNRTVAVPAGASDATRTEDKRTSIKSPV